MMMVIIWLMMVNNIIWLVVDLPLLKNMSSSIGMMTFPRYGKKMFQTTNQLVTKNDSDISEV